MFTVFGHLSKLKLLVTLERQKIIVKFPHGLSVGHGDQRNTNLLHIRVHVALNINTHGRGAFIQDRIHWLVVDQASHRDSLLLTARKHIIPIILCFPSTFSLNQVTKLCF